MTDDEDTVHRLWRIDDPSAIETFKDALRDTELLIADGHHRYETARVYQQEEPSADHVLMCLVALQDSGLTVFPTHRPGHERRPRARSRTALERDWTTEPRETLSIGYYADGEERTLYLKDLAIADAALEGKPEPYRRLDTAVLEALILKGALGHERGRHLALQRPRLRAHARGGAAPRSTPAQADAAFFMSPTPVERVRDVAAAGENMPPKSTYFFPKVLTGMVFNPLEERWPS